MKKNLLLSTLMIGAVLAVVAGAGTFATFTDQATGSQTVTSGSVDVLVNGDAGDNFAISLTGGPGCPSNMAFGDTCTFALTVANNGTLSETTAFTLTETDTNNCWTTTYALPSGDVEGGDAHNDHDPGDSHATTLSTTLDNDAAVCQGSSNTISLTIDATQSPSPHN
ncbi:MAG: SipW-dependent-type signal peptide-containing protein [Dehalococcoidia bacterium]